MSETVSWAGRFDPMTRPHDRSVAVLVVEDEYLIRMDTASSLEAAGFIVFEAERSGGHPLPRGSWRNQAHFHRRQHARLDGWVGARPLRPRTMGSGENHRDLGLYEGTTRYLPPGALFVEKPYYPDNIADRINELIVG
jgi:hypothetical protein